MPQVNCHDATLFVHDAGAGPPVLFVHGFPLHHGMWQAQLDALQDHFRVLAPDLRGFGHSSAAGEALTMPGCGDDLAALLDALGIEEPVCLCGLSMGGYIAWPFVRKYAHRLRSLILCDTRARPDTPEGIENRHRMARSVLAHGARFAADALLPKLFAPRTLERSPEVRRAVEAMILEASPASIAAALEGMAARPDSTPLLPNIRVPTLVLVGAEDTITPPDEMREIARSIPEAAFVEVPGAGHMAPMEDAEAVNIVLRSFLEETAN